MTQTVLKLVKIPFFTERKYQVLIFSVVTHRSIGLSIGSSKHIFQSLCDSGL